MNEVLETITVLIDGQPVRINATDYDADRHALPDTPQGQQEPQAPAQGQQEPQAPAQGQQEPQAPAQGQPQLAVVKRGRKFFVTDSQGQDVEGFDPSGYKAENEAWNAILGVGNG